MEHPKIKFVIDLSWLHSRSKFAFRDLTWSVDGVTYATGSIFGVYDALVTILEVYGQDVEIILAMDGTPKKQQGVAGSYKAGRGSDDSLGMVQVSRWDVAKHFLLLPQVTMAYHKWTEADEVMGHIAKTKKDNETVILFSGDGDLRQLIDSGKNIFCACEYKRGVGYILEDEAHLFEKGVKELDGLHPDSVALHLAICGDSSDGISGIPRFLRAVSKEISNQAKTFDVLKDMVASAPTLPEGKVKNGLLRIGEEIKQVEDNWKLTYIDPIYIPNYYTLDNFKDEVSLEWFDRYGCQKVYSDLSILLGQGVRMGALDNTIPSSTGLGQELPSNTMLGGVTEFDFGG